MDCSKNRIVKYCSQKLLSAIDVSYCSFPNTGLKENIKLTRKAASDVLICAIFFTYKHGDYSLEIAIGILKCEMRDNL